MAAISTNPNLPDQASFSTRARKARIKKLLTQIPAYLILSLWSFFTIFVIGWVIISSFKTNAEIFRTVFDLPKVWQFSNYINAWSQGNFALYLRNSVFLTSASVAGLLLISAPAAYVLSRFKFIGRNFLTTTFIAGMGIPYSLVLIPLYVIMSRLGLINNLPGLILIYISLSIPFTVYILTGFFVTLPKELEDAAVIDGCNEFQTFWHVMLPLASPGLLTAGIFNAIGMWNEYQLVLVFMGNEEGRTLALGLYSLQNAMQYTGDWVGLFAGVCIIMVPTIVLYVILSEKMIAGITMGAVK